MVTTKGRDGVNRYFAQLPGQLTNVLRGAGKAGGKVITDEIKARTPAWPPNLLPGDFNGDREVDVAVLMECKGTVQLIAFVARDAGFSRFGCSMTYAGVATGVADYTITAAHLAGVVER